MRRVGELAELARDEVGRALADVHCVVADPLEAARDEDHPKAPLVQLRISAEREDVLDKATVGAVDQLVEVDQRLRLLEVARRERVERDLDHLLGTRAHLFEPVDERAIRRDCRRELDELRDRHAVIGDPLEVQVHVQHSQDEPKVARDGRLAGKQ
jgi:hypothetical protein